MATYAMPFLEIQDAGQDLARRTVCIKIQRSRLGNSKKVNSSQVEVDTDKTMINVSKRLFTSREYAAIRNFDGEVTRYLESTCLPFERGIHLCPLPLLKQVELKMREFADQRVDLVEAFVAVYPELCQHAPGQLRALHNPLDYPPVEEVRAAFDFSWRYVSFGVPDQLREISSEIWDQEREKTAKTHDGCGERSPGRDAERHGRSGSPHERPAEGWPRRKAHAVSPDDGFKAGGIPGWLQFPERHGRRRTQEPCGTSQRPIVRRQREGLEDGC